MKMYTCVTVILEVHRPIETHHHSSPERVKITFFFHCFFFINYLKKGKGPCLKDWEHSDETKLQRFGHYQRRSKKGEAFVEKSTMPTVKHVGGSIMLWGCVAAGGTGTIV